MPITWSLINRATRWSAERGLSPGARSNPSRRADNTTSLSNPAPGPRDSSTEAGSTPRAAERSDAVTTPITQHLLHHAMLRLGRE
jgi:hypothetical protein